MGRTCVMHAICWSGDSLTSWLTVLATRGVQVGISFAAWNAYLFEGLSFKKAGIIFSDFFAGECGEVAAFEFAQVIFYFGRDLEYIAYPFGCLVGAFLGAGVEAANVKVFSEAFANEQGLLFAPM